MSFIYSIERSLGADIVLLAGALVIILVLGLIHGLRRAGRHDAAKGFATAALLLALVGVVVATLNPAGSGTPWQRLILDPVLGATDGHGRTVWRPLVANVVLFVPLGAVAAARFPGRGMRVWFALVAFSIGVESAQYLLPIGRIANAADVVANAGGAALGVGLDALVRRVVGVRSRQPVRVPEPVTVRRRP